MANDVRITTGVTGYISKSGSDANSGLTPDLPKLTLSNFATVTTVGCGQYKGAFTLSNNTVARQYYADGQVKINATGALVMTMTSGIITCTIGSTSIGNRFILAMAGNNINFSIGTARFNNCLIDTAVFTKSGAVGTLNLNYCIVKDCTSNAFASATTIADYTMLFNSTLQLNLSATSSFTNSYANETSIIVSAAYFTTPSTQFINCNFEGKFNISATLYELKKDKAGVLIPARIGNGIADISVIDATVYTRGNFAQDPLLLNLSKQDFNSVSALSPMLFANNTGSGNVGGVRFAKVVKATDAEFASPVSSSNIATSVGDLIFSGTPPSGIIVSKPYQIAPIAQVVQYMDFVGLFEYDSLQIIGGAENKNVVQVEAYAPATAGINPGRLVREYRWTESTTEPVLDADYTNSGYIDGGHPAGSYFRFEKGTMPLVSTLLVGNGDPTFSSASAGPIKICWIQERVTIFQGR